MDRNVKSAKIYVKSLLMLYVFTKIIEVDRERIA